MRFPESAPLVEPVNTGLTVHPGMTLRDYFAAQALAGYTSRVVRAHQDSISAIADLCYIAADAMLEARNEIP